MPGQEQEPVPEPEQPPPGAPGGADAGPVPDPAGLDWQALLEALAAGGLLDGDPDGLDAAAAAGQGRMSAPLAAGQAGALAVEHMNPGPAQAGWLAAAAAETASLDEYGLAGVAIAARQLASWAQAAELGAVAQITARAAAADSKIGLTADGRPARVCRDALGQISLALMLTGHSATAWADLAVTLAWRLPETGAALAAGRVDLARARVIAEATSVLGEDAARAVEAKILPEAGRQTTAQLRVRLRRLVMAADPGGAERRRQDAERQAKVSLYADDDGTATLAGAGLPAVEAAAAMARITALARAAKAAGQAGGLDLHRARVMLGLLLGTLPYIPPPGGAPEPEPPGGGDAGPGGGDPGSGPLAGDGTGSSRPGIDGPGGPDDGHHDDWPGPRDQDAPPVDGADDGDPGDSPHGGHENDGGEGDDWPGAGPVPPWPGLGAIAPALARPGVLADGQPVPGLLDVTLPWATLAGLTDAPGLLGRIGPVTAAQARGHPPPGTGLVGRITVTITADTIHDHTTSAPGPPARAVGPGPPAGAAGPGPPAQAARPGPPSRIAAAALRAAARALDTAHARARADTAAGGCAHHAQSPAYRPPPRLREHVTARDVTCRHPARRQPAWRADLDHSCRAHLHRQPRHPPAVAPVARWAIMDGCRRS